MANEITVTAGLRLAKGTGDAAIAHSKSYSDSVTMSGTEYIENIQIVGTSTEALVVGDVGTQGYVLLRNLDTTNFVIISTTNDSSNPVIQLNAGEVAVFRAQAALYAKADTANCRVYCAVYEA